MLFTFLSAVLQMILIVCLTPLTLISYIPIVKEISSAFAVLISYSAYIPFVDWGYIADSLIVWFTFIVMFYSSVAIFWIIQKVAQIF